MKETEEKEKSQLKTINNITTEQKKDPFWKPTYFLVVFVLGYLLFSIFRSLLIFQSQGVLDLSKLQVFNTVFISILIQVFSFMLIGILVSSAIHVFVPDQFILKIFPTKYGLGFITAMFVGLFLPVCECAIVPIMTSLVKKGVAIPIAITFMLSAPIINPIVIISTLYAFPEQPKIALFRVLFGLTIALIVGLVLFFLRINPSILLSEEKNCKCTCNAENKPCTCHCHNEELHQKGITGKIKVFFLHAGEEFFDVGKYLIVGAFITSLIQTFVPTTIFINIEMQKALSLFLMMAMAFLFSACSTSDSFIARSFVNKISIGAIMGFLVFGPMMDLKNIMMLMANFKKKFIVILVLLIFILNFLMLYFFAFLF